MTSHDFAHWLMIFQGAYFALTGVWPLLSIRTFMMVTGPKHDLWLVKTVGILITVIGVVMLVAGLRGNITPEMILLAAGSSAALAAVDIYYVFRRVIARIYLADAAAEIVLIILWIVICGMTSFAAA